MVYGAIWYIYMYACTYHCKRAYSSSRSLSIQANSCRDIPPVKEALRTNGTLPHSAGLCVFISDNIL